MDDWKDEWKWELGDESVYLQHMRRRTRWRMRWQSFRWHMWRDIREAPQSLKYVWLDMAELPWRVSQEDKEMRLHSPWIRWTMGWTWALAGLVGGALVAPSLTLRLGLAGTSYEDWLVIAMAVLAGFLVQLIGWGLFLLSVSLTAPLAIYIANRLGDSGNLWTIVRAVRITDWFTLPVIALMPLAGVGYGLYYYFTWVGAGQSSVTIAFVGGLFVKTFLIPLIKALVTGTLLKWFMKWLHGGKDTKNAD